MAEERTEDPTDNTVRRSIEVDAEPDEVWHAVIDDSERADWFGGPTELTPTEGAGATFTEPDGQRRHATVDSVVPQRRLGWTWLDDDGNASGQVTIDLSPAPSGTRIDVTETLQIPRLAPQSAVLNASCGARPTDRLRLAPQSVVHSASCGARPRVGATWRVDLVELEHMLLLRSAGLVGRVRI